MFKIYSSSAGSGKTYTLTKEYLKLALQPGKNDSYFKHILAITFTNAAANEMKERILGELRRFAEGESTPLLADVILELHGIKPTDAAFETARAEVCNKAQTVFRTILHSYSDFSVTTIDSFTQRLVTAFTDELGLPYSFEVEMETDEVLELATDQLLEKAGTDEMEEITEILKQYFEETATDGQSWNALPGDLRDFGKNLVSDQYYEAINRIADLTPGDIRTIRQQMRDFVKRAETDIGRTGADAWQLITVAGLTVGDFKGGKNGIGSFFERVADGEWDKNITNTYLNTVRDDDWYGSKIKLPTQGAIDSIADALKGHFNDIQKIRQQVNLLKCLIPHLQKLALLKQIRAEFDALLRKDGRVHISEFNKRIQAIVAAEPVPFIYERLGNKYFHILIDEFQDTSRMQFANLLPLIENSLGFANFNLAVGDGKQAIYRFRGGDMDQIVSLHQKDLGSLRDAHGTGWTADRIESLDGHLTSEVLGVNWRSAEPIVRFNNQFFEFIARSFDGEHGKIADVFDVKKVFHQQPGPKARPEAHIQIDFVQAGGPTDGPDAEGEGDEKDLTALMLDKTLEHITTALADGYRYGDIAVLCRKKAQAKALANELNAKGIPLVSADSLSLQFSDPVKWLIAVMSLLNHPEQKLLRYELLYLFWRVIKGQFPDDAQTEVLRTIAESTTVTGVYDYLDAAGYELDANGLSQLNVYELAETLTHRFGLFDQVADHPFLFRFLDEVLTFNNRQSGHLADFLLYWDSVQGKVSVGADASANAVSIQTIHKVKGLEYPVVIIPFANWSVDPMAGSEIWLDLDQTVSDALHLTRPDGNRIKLTNSPVKLNRNLLDTNEHVGAQYTEEVTRTFIENLNLLYVAFTRPTDRMYIISERKDFSKEGKKKNIAYWLHKYLKESDTVLPCGCRWDEGLSTYVLTDCVRAFPHDKSKPTTGEIVIGQVISGSRGQELQLRRQADRVFDVQTFAITRERDRKLSAALSLILGPDCIDKTLRRLVSEGVVRLVECAELRQRLQQIVHHPDLTELFNDKLRIDTDRSILSRNRLHKAPHRVVYQPDGRVILVQYESDPVTAPAHAMDDEAAELLPNDPIKILRYFTNLYREMGNAEVEGRLVYLKASGPEVVRVG